MNDESLTKDASAGCVVVPKQVHALTALASLIGLESEENMETPPTRGSEATSDNVFSKDYTDRYVASVTPTPSGTDYFRVAALNAVAAGHLTPGGFDNLMIVHEAIQRGER